MEEFTVGMLFSAASQCPVCFLVVVISSTAVLNSLSEWLCLPSYFHVAEFLFSQLALCLFALCLYEKVAFLLNVFPQAGFY